MTEQERRFKVTKIDKYNSQILTEEGKIGQKSIGVLITAILAIDFIAKTTALTPSDAMFYIDSVLGGTSAIGSLTFLKGMITSISKKTTLESKVEDLKEEISFYDSENKKSRGAR